jgi:lysophospholipase L1-like esterase
MYSMKRWPSHLAYPLLFAAAALQSFTPSQAAQEQPGGRGREPTEKDLGRHQGFLERKDRLIKTGGTQLVFVGDSITDGWRSDPQREIFEDYFGRYRPYNIGIGGDETQHVLWRINHGELDGLSPKVVVLMIGTNNLANANKMSPEEAADGVAAVVQAIHGKLPNSKVLLLNIFPRANRSDDPLRLAVNATNTIIARLQDRKTVFYLDIGSRFLSPDGTLSGDIMPDYLHPNAKGYQIWADAIKGEIDRLERTP